MSSILIHDHSLTLEKLSQHFFKKERVSLCNLDDLIADCVRQMGNGHQALDQNYAFLLGQRVHNNLGVAVREFAFRHYFCLPRGCGTIGAKGSKDKKRDLIGEIKEMLQKINRSRIGPVQIVEDHYPGLLCGPGPNHLTYHLK